MTVSSQSNRITYAGNGVTTVFSTSPVVFFNSTDLEVYKVATATGTATLQTLNVDYTVTGGSGAVGTVSATVAPTTVQNLLILRVMPLTQAVDFVNNDPSDAEVAEDAIDKLTMITQQLDESVGRAILLNVSSALTDVQIPDFTGKAGQIMTVNAAMNGFTLVAALTNTVTASAFMVTLLDDETAAAARTTLGVPALAGVAGGQVVNGGVAASESLTLRGTAHATTGNVKLNDLGGEVIVGGGTTASNLRFMEPSGSGTNYSEFKAQAQAGNIAYTLPAADAVGAANKLTSNGSGALTWASPITLSAEQASTSGTVITFTGIPAGTKQITVSFDGVSINGASNFLVKIGDVGGIEDAGYVAVGNFMNQASGTSGGTSTDGFIMASGGAGTVVLGGSMTLTLQDASGFTWVSSHATQIGSNSVGAGGGHKSLSAEMTQISVSSVGGDTFDLGAISISYQ